MYITHLYAESFKNDIIIFQCPPVILFDTGYTISQVISLVIIIALSLSLSLYVKCSANFNHRSPVTCFGRMCMASFTA